MCYANNQNKVGLLILIALTADKIELKIENIGIKRDILHW